MKIGIDIRTLMDKRYFGVSSYTKSLVAKILEIDNKNSYKLFYNSFFGDDRNIPQYIGDNIEIVQTKIPNKCFNYCLTKTFRRPLIDKMLDVDVFFMPHINFVSLSKKSKKIIAVHDLSFLRYPEYFSLRKNVWHWLVNIRKLLQQFDRIIAMSINTKMDIVELCGIDPEKISVIYSGIDFSFRHIADNDITEGNKIKDILRKYRLPDNFILQQGAIEPRKNTIGSIEAFEYLSKKHSLKELHLVIAGGKGWKYREVFKKAAKSEFSANIHFPGYIDKKDQIYLYNAAKVLLYPSFYEGFGFPPLEAMACGTPVIASNISSIPEVTGTAALLVDPHNIGSISRALEILIYDKNVRERYIYRGLTTYQKYNWKSTAEKYIAEFTNG